MDSSDHVLHNIHRIQEGSHLSGKSKAKKQLQLALEAPLVLTGIVYYAMGAIHHLPSPLQYDQTIVFYSRANILRSPVTTRERRQPPQAQEAEESSKEEVVEPLKKRMQGSVRVMPAPPRPRIPPASLAHLEPDAQPLSPALNGEGDGEGDDDDEGNAGHGGDDTRDEATMKALQDMIDKDTKVARAQWAEWQRAKEL